MNGKKFIKINKYYINVEHLKALYFLCNAPKCFKLDKCCCKSFEVDVSFKEMQRIINIMDVIYSFCPNLKKGKYYRNSFIENDNKLIIDKKNNDYCVFSYFDDSKGIKCGIHSAALKLNLDPYLYKPKSCSIWPFIVNRDTSGNIFLNIDIESNIICIKKKKIKDNIIDKELQKLLQIILKIIK